MSLKSINVKKTGGGPLYYDGIDANGKDPTTLSTTPLNNQDLSTMNKNEKNYGLNYGRGRMRGMIR